MPRSPKKVTHYRKPQSLTLCGGHKAWLQDLEDVTKRTVRDTEGTEHLNRRCTRTSRVYGVVQVTKTQQDTVNQALLCFHWEAVHVVTPAHTAVPPHAPMTPHNKSASAHPTRTSRCRLTTASHWSADPHDANSWGNQHGVGTANVSVRPTSDPLVPPRNTPIVPETD